MGLADQLTLLRPRPNDILLLRSHEWIPQSELEELYRNLHATGWHGVLIVLPSGVSLEILPHEDVERLYRESRVGASGIYDDLAAWLT